jgi:catechol 2,3-dioxygenase-like lactoylglutathione lyase family enzyme
MSSAITKVDHAILFVRDLEAAATRYRRLGFTLTPRYTHPWGGFSNHNIVFEQDYVELLLPIEPNERNLARFRELDRSGEGLKDISLAVPDSPAAARVYAAAGLPSLPPASRRYRRPTSAGRSPAPTERTTPSSAWAICRSTVCSPASTST